MSRFQILKMRYGVTDDELSDVAQMHGPLSDVLAETILITVLVLRLRDVQNRLTRLEAAATGTETGIT
jgi:hypothetical protein